MTSLYVITFKIGQSAGKTPKSVKDEDMVFPQRPHGHGLERSSQP
jgi:hypothetical protein